jgi:cytochrome c
LKLVLAALCSGALAAAACGTTGNGEKAAAVGPAAYAQCYSCHSLEPGENLPSGPTLHAIVGRAVAAEPGFDYSPALRRFAQANPRWTPQLLDRFIADPEALVPGTYMSFHGMADPAERDALIAWLQRP